MKNNASKIAPVILAAVFFAVLIFAIMTKKADDDLQEDGEVFYIQNVEAQEFFDPANTISISPSPEEECCYILYAFASWCKSCEKSQEFLSKIKEETDMKIVGLSWDNDKNALRNWLEKHGNQFDEIGVLSSDLVTDLGISSIPALFIIGEDGRILYHDDQELDEKKLIDALKGIDAAALK